MKVTIWGARGSIPTPVRPEEVRQKISSALLGIAGLEDGAFKEELLAAILEHPPAGAAARQTARRAIVEAYLNRLSPLVAGTAGGNTPCIEIRAESDLFIIDAGSGIRDLGLKLMQGEWGQGKGVIHLFFSHPHWDHIQGFPFFRPAFVPGNKIFIYSVHDIEAALRRQQSPISFPVSLDYMQAEMTFVRLKPEETLEFGDLRIRTIRNHHPGDSYSFRFEKGNKAFVYASDASYPAGIDLRPYLNFFAEADVLIYDAQFTQRESDEKEDWGHSSSFVGVEMAQQARVKTLVLYHYDPTYTDPDLEKILEDTLRFQQTQYPDREPVKVLVAHEGHTFDLTSHYRAELRQVPGSNAALLKPGGIFDEQVVAELREQLIRLKGANGLPHLIIDMSAVDLLPVTALRALVKLKKEQSGVTITLAGPTSKVQQLVELAGYLDLFAIQPSVHAALSTIQAHETLNLPGQMLKNRYYIEAKMGDGRLGTVFKATDTRLNRPVAIKILSSAFSEGAIEQFLQHGRQIVDLAHPNIVDVYDCDEDHGLYFMVEELFEGQTLRDVIDEHAHRPLPLNTALRIAENIAQALEHAHARGVIHGDLKPKNVLLANQVKISDFGLGRLESGQSLLGIDEPLALVSVHYLAPEQVLGHPIDARTDLYALGVILYELFTGQRPFEGKDREVLDHHLNRAPRSPRELNPALSRSLEHLILKLLDKDPNRRYASARQTRRILSSMALLSSGEVQPYLFSHQPRHPLVGRERALKQLDDLWQKTLSGRGQLVFITGETGIGKTRLAQEFAQHISQATLLVGSCQNPDGNRPYQPFIDALQMYIANEQAAAGNPAAVAGLPVVQVLTELAAAIPQIRPFLPEAVTVGNGPPRAKTRPVSLARAIARAATRHPWLLILDDLHRADEGSLRVLQYLARHCAQLPLMIVGIYPAGEADEETLQAGFLDALGPHTSATTIHLDHLTESQVTEYLNNLWVQTVPADLVAAIHRRARGNPFFVGEIARALTDENVVSWRARKWHFAPVVEVNLPRHVRDAIQRRITRLPRDTQTLLTQAAVLGMTFTLAELQEMSDLPEATILDRLDIALERQLVSQSPGDRLLRFSHVEIQQVLYGQLSALKRREMHRLAGDALERYYQANPGQIAEKLAYHFCHAGVLDKGIRYSIRAGRQAEAIYAYRQALTRYTQALEALDQLEAGRKSRRQRFELLLAREQINHYLAGRQAQAADLSLLEKLVGPSGDRAARAILYYRQARLALAAGDVPQAAEKARAALKIAPPEHAGVKGDSLLVLARIALSRGEFEAAHEKIHLAARQFESAGRKTGKAQCLDEAGAVYRHQNDYPQAGAVARQAVELHQKLGNWPGMAAALRNMAAFRLADGDYSRALAALQQSLEISRLVADRGGQAMCRNMLAATCKELGQLSLARHYLQKALAIHRDIGDPQDEAEDLKVLGAIHLAGGDFVLARDYSGEALEIFQRLGFKVAASEAWLELGLAQEALGDLVKAHAAYSQARLIRQETGNKTGELDARAGLARCLLAQGQTKQARQEIESLLAGLNLPRLSGSRYPIRLYLTAYWVLQAANNKDMAVNILRAGHEFLQNRAKTIENPEFRRQFLEDVPENKELITQLAQFSAS